MSANAQSLDRKRRHAPTFRGGITARGERRRKRTANHQTDDLVVVDIRDRKATDLSAIPNDRQAVAKATNLLHPMRYEDDRHPLIAKRLDAAREPFDVST